MHDAYHHADKVYTHACASMGSNERTNFNAKNITAARFLDKYRPSTHGAEKTIISNGTYIIITIKLSQWIKIRKYLYGYCIRIWQLNLAQLLYVPCSRICPLGFNAIDLLQWTLQLS